MKKTTIISAELVLGLVFGFAGLAVPDASLAEESTGGDAASLAEAFTKGKAYLSFRYRYEYVDQEGFAKDANASTLRTRVGYGTAPYYGTQGLIELEDVQSIGSDRYNSTVNGRTDYPVVADPEGTEVNQAYLKLISIPDTVIKGGRHTLVLDNVRFIGDVGWRQNNQTQDGVTLTNTSLDDTTFFYGYARSINRIFGEDSDVGQFDTHVHMFNIRYEGLSFGKAIAYAYLLDIQDAPALSSTTYGGRFDGGWEVSEGTKLLYDFEYAYQTDYKDNPVSYSANYFRVVPGISYRGFTLKGGFESLGSDNGTAAFQTPLATLHAWNGWADKFLSTPDAGLEDLYGVIGYKVNAPDAFYNGLSFKAIYHDFSSQEGNSDYGREWDFLLTKKIFSQYTIGVKYAAYDAKDHATDTDKLWFIFSTKFSQ